MIKELVTYVGTNENNVFASARIPNQGDHVLFTLDSSKMMISLVDLKNALKELERFKRKNPVTIVAIEENVMEFEPVYEGG